MRALPMRRIRQGQMAIGNRKLHSSNDFFDAKD
jgi:hypothetical protein